MNLLHQVPTKTELVKNMLKGLSEAVINELTKNFKHFIPYIEYFGEVIEVIVNKAIKDHKAKLHLIKCKDAIVQILANANNYLKDSRDALQFATLDENQVAQLKHNYQTRNYKSIIAHVSQMDAHLADCAKSLDKFKTQCTDAIQTCTVKNTFWVGAAVATTLAVCYPATKSPFCILASVGAGIGVSYFLKSDEKYEKFENLFGTVYSTRTSLEEFAHDLEAIKIQAGHVRYHAEHPQGSDANAFGKVLDIMINRVQRAKNDLPKKFTEIDIFMKNAIDQ